MDSHFRGLQRRAEQTGAPADWAALYSEIARKDPSFAPRLQLAAELGHPIAELAAGVFPDLKDSFTVRDYSSFLARLHSACYIRHSFPGIFTLFAVNALKNIILTARDGYDRRGFDNFVHFYDSCAEVAQLIAVAHFEGVPELEVPSMFGSLQIRESEFMTTYEIDNMHSLYIFLAEAGTSWFWAFEEFATEQYDMSQIAWIPQMIRATLELCSLEAPSLDPFTLHRTNPMLEIIQYAMGVVERQPIPKVRNFVWSQVFAPVGELLLKIH